MRPCSACPWTCCLGLAPNWGNCDDRSNPKGLLDLVLPAAGIVVTSSRALFWQTCSDVGDSKCTDGIGSVHPHEHRR